MKIFLFLLQFAEIFSASKNPIPLIGKFTHLVDFKLNSLSWNSRNDWIGYYLVAFLEFSVCLPSHFDGSILPWLFCWLYDKVIMEIVLFATKMCYILLYFQTISIKRNWRSNQSKQIERNQPIGIQFSNEIETQYSNSHLIKFRLLLSWIPFYFTN